MNIGILIPGFGAHEEDWALPVYQNLARELAKTHHVHVIALRYPHTQQPYNYHNVAVYPLGYGAWTRGIRRVKLWWDTFQLVKKLHREKPFDILHGIWADETGALSGWTGKRLNVPSVVTVAGGEKVGFPDIGYGLQISRYSRWIVDQAWHNNDLIFIPSQMGDLFPGFKGHKRLGRVSLGIDPTVFYPSDVIRKPKHLIHVGSLIPIKNQKMILDAMTFLDEEVTLDIIGEGPLEEELKRYTDQLGIFDRVNFLGKVSHTKLREHYSRAQLHILTSHHEAFGMAVLEAAACGTPTVGTNVGLLSDKPEFTVSIATVRELADTIQDLLTSPPKWETLHLHCIDKVGKHYTVENMAKQHVILYNYLMKTNHIY